MIIYIVQSFEFVKMNKNDIMYKALKRARKESREEEIRLYGKPINHNKVFRNKKIYSRKRFRVDL